jgi:hypothetical protein
MLTRVWRSMTGPDRVLAGMALALSALVAAFWGRLERPWLYLAYHAAALGLVALSALGARHSGRSLWRILRDWYPLLLVPAAFAELHYLAPELGPIDGDRLLDEWDRRLFGDVRAAVAPLLSPGVVDLLTVCYLSYFVTPPALAVVLWRRPDPAAYRESMTVCLLGWYLSYLLYLVVPGKGPYSLPHDLVPKANLLAGCHARLLEWEGAVPTAFPSGHVLVTVLVLACAWRHARRFFWIALAPGVGLIVATIGLRYHYVVDVAAALLLAPPVAWAGLRIQRAATSSLPP